MELADLLPDVTGQWRKAADDALFEGESIFKYMNGAGEVYLSFDFRRMLVRRYEGGGEKEITVELYDMGNPADAFGIFARNRRGTEAGIGQGSEFRSGYLVFWKNRFFATAYTSGESDEAQSAVLEIGRAIAANIPEKGGKPAIVSLLPEERLLEESIRYFHKYTDLNHHYFLADENILGLGMDTEAVIANYRFDDTLLYLLIIRYPNADRARDAHLTYANIFTPQGGEKGVARLEDGYWTAGDRTGPYFYAVFDAPASRSAGELLASTRARIEGDTK